MSEFSFSSTTKKTGFSNLLLSDFLHCCFFMFSHPLYFSYLIFFSPYILKLLSFLSPLFITTTLLLLALLTTTVSPTLVQNNSHSQLSESKLGFLSATYQTVSERLRSKFDHENCLEEEFQPFEELDVYKIVFESSTFEIREDPLKLVEKKTCLESINEEPVDKHLTHEQRNAVHTEEEEEEEEEKEDEISKLKQNPIEISIAGEAERSKWSLEEQIVFEDIPCEKEDRKVKAEVEESKKVEKRKERLFTRSESKEAVVLGNKIKDDEIGEGYHTPKLSSDDGNVEYDYYYSMKAMEGSNLGSFGSMRKEKEWRRTLACKLFEERHNGDGGEGMDMLWETYETESNRALNKSKATNKGKKKSGGLVLQDYNDEDDIEDGDGQLCCLQALKFSAGKMNLGMGRPNLMKISKALKGFGWLHHVSRGKKVYH